MSIVLTDGGMGQELIRRSGKEPTPLWSARVLMDEPGPGARPARRFHSGRCAGHHHQHLFGDAGTAGARRHGRVVRAVAGARLSTLAAVARDLTGEDVRIAGLPAAALRQPTGPTWLRATTNAFRSTGRLSNVQADRVDLMLCETLASLKEIRAAATAATESGKPVWVGMTRARRP